jgi:hypothetical protein
MRRRTRTASLPRSGIENADAPQKMRIFCVCVCVCVCVSGGLSGGGENPSKSEKTEVKKIGDVT